MLILSFITTKTTTNIMIKRTVDRDGLDERELKGRNKVPKRQINIMTKTIGLTLTQFAW